MPDAEDAAADALLAALEAYPRLRDDSDVKAWLVTIAHRKALDVLRRRARQAIPVAQVPEHGASTDLPLLDESLWSAVRGLSDKQRLAVVYRYVGDLTYADIAGLMGTSEAAARRNAADGIKALRRAYRPPQTARTGSATLEPIPSNPPPRQQPLEDQNQHREEAAP